MVVAVPTAAPPTALAIAPQPPDASRDWLGGTLTGTTVCDGRFDVVRAGKAAKRGDSGALLAIEDAGGEVPAPDVLQCIFALGSSL